MLSALAHDQTICSFCCNARSTDPRYWREKRQTDALKDWKLHFLMPASEMTEQDYDAQIGGYVDKWCGRGTPSVPDGRGDDFFPVSWSVFLCWEQRYDMASEDDGRWMSTWCPPCSMQVLWEAMTLSRLLAEAGYQDRAGMGQ